jgi:hypothetical protein
VKPKKNEIAIHKSTLNGLDAKENYHKISQSLRASRHTPALTIVDTMHSFLILRRNDENQRML